MFYSVYMVLSIMISLTVAAIPAILLFAFVVQNFTNFLNTIWPFNIIHLFVIDTFGYWIPPFAQDYWWLLILFVPLGLVCYTLFLGVLLGMFKLSRRGIPYLEDGFYKRETEAWLLYEYFEIYYRLFPYFAGFFSIFLNTKPIHTLFGAKIGKNSIVGNGLIMNPERTIMGDNSFLGYGSIVCAHVYEDDGIYLKEIKIGNDVTVGGYAIIFPGAIIGDNVIIGANTVVPKDRTIPPNTIWVHGKAIPRKTDPTIEEMHQPIGGPPVMDPENDSSTPQNGEHM
jgi:acetyltransferase-like isoleucine patch superfamily enzyme